MTANESDTIARSVEALRNALLDADKSTLDRLCAGKLTYGHSAGTLENKEQFVTANTNGFARWLSLEFNDQSIEVSGDTALVRHTMVGETEHSGKVHPIKIGILLVWQRQDGAWKLLARQAYKY
jgi:ketosteroid isomerase-like protein